jgi:hypothetical protein
MPIDQGRGLVHHLRPPCAVLARLVGGADARRVLPARPSTRLGLVFHDAK